jgi:primary-amine oxidase
MLTGGEDITGQNVFGVGYATHSTVIEKECGLDLDITKARVFKINNENKVKPITNTPLGFEIYPQPSQMLLAHPDSFHAKRSEFGKHAIWVTRLQDDELYPAVTHAMQSMGGEGIQSVIARRAKESGDRPSIRNQDIVVWHTFESTHNPRLEDWPVIPQERMAVSFKPVNFFLGNTGLDVPVSSQDNNCSVLVETQTDKPQDCCASRL